MIKRWIGVFLVLVLQICGFLLFARGFFPKKLVLPGYSEYYGDGYLGDARFNKLVFMIVDAMRSDFMFSNESSMDYVHQLIRQGKGIPFTAHSTPPTVTLPRIKGLTTGSTPNFLDAILNIAEEDTSSTLADQDSWLQQLKRQNKRIHMFGDDTWIKLFPGVFEKTDGTASFFVSDFTEVDNNVTRHIDEELSSQEWDVLILHYLGLDHIGHKGGPESPFMPVKQKEMDSIFQKIHESVDDNTLLVLCGDHGMNEAGNHGGSSAGETSPGMVFVSNKFNRPQKAPLNPPEHGYEYYRRIQQADLVPTLSALMHFPIPKNSLGVVVKELLDELWVSDEERSLVLAQNVAQVANILKSSFSNFKDIDADEQAFCQSMQDFDSDNELESLRCLWWKCQEDPDEELDFEFLSRAQGLLSQVSSNYNETDMRNAILMLAAASLISLFQFLSLKSTTKLVKFVHLLITMLYFTSMFGSSNVEEEHHFWYWGATGWVAWCYIRDSRRKFNTGINWVVCLVLVRIIRGWNQTGQKYAGGPDIAKYLELDQNSTVLWFFITLYYAQLTERLWRSCFSDVNSMAGFVFSFTTTVSSLMFKMHMAYEAGDAVPSIVAKLVESGEDNPDMLISLARLSFFTIGVGALYQLSKIIFPPEEGRDTIRPITNLSYILEVLLVNQTRTRNILVFPFFYLMRYYVRMNAREVSTTVIFLLILQHVSFFALGNSNSLASIDLSNAYNGVRSYNMTIVGILTYISNWVGPLYWSITGLSILLESHIFKVIPRQKIIVTRTIINQVFFSMASLGIMGACLVLKHHLFIWTVFSPKLLYSAAWLIIQHGLVDVILTIVFTIL
ncbi:GPI ethanolamine phosphate transferase 2 [Trichomonascus vanleenenianus]|uniref:mannose-ethanolamine phosphotransferase LAS21 n=1 Tax=Trichomonascus vanleenenianus TaxID=2268995 RepID=UPI003EC961AC